MILIGRRAAGEGISLRLIGILDAAIRRKSDEYVL